MGLLSVFAFIWGALWGSFLNVVVHRLPLGMSLVRPASHCPSCETPIRWYDNVPLVSYLVLRGRCRRCRARISPRYPAIEALTAILSLLLFLKCGAGRLDTPAWPVVLVPFLFYFWFICAAIAVSVIDLTTTRIPDSVTIPTAILGLVAALVIPKGGILADLHPSVTWLDSLIGGLSGALLFLAVIYGYRLLTGRVGMGGGDVTMMAMIGAFLGWRSLIFVLFFASFQGVLGAVIAALVERWKGKKGQLLLRGVHRPEFWAEQPDGPAQGEVEEERRRTGDQGPRQTGEPVLQEGTEGGQPMVPPPPEESEIPFGKVGIPFGPFLALAGVEYLLIGEWFERWMMGGG